MRPDEPPPEPRPDERDDRAAPPSAAPRSPSVQTTQAVARAMELEHRIQAVADTLPTSEERAIEVVEAALDALGASVALAARLTADGSAVELTGGAHLPGDLEVGFRVLPLDAPMPVADVARTGRPCYCESRAALLDRFPAMRDVVERLDLHAMAAVPVRHLARVQGAIAFGFPRPHRFTPGEKALLRALGGRYARALHAARRYYAEHDARAADMAARRVAEEARAVAEAASSAQRDYVAVVSHELRTPLQAILGYADLLTEGIGGTLTSTQRDYVDRIAAGGGSLLQIVENLLGFSAAQVGRQRVDVDTFDVRRIVSDVVALAEPLAGRKALAIRVEAPADAVTMTSDLRKVRQIVTNLVGNAIKFTERGEVVVAVAAPEPERVRIAVRDTGVGIEAVERPHLFEPFWQGNPRQMASTSGTGLGLSIVRQLAELLGGDVEVASEPGAGATFTVDLPVFIPVRPADAPPSAR
ncbi:MAG: GAF domain-containing sensor histidine kinase [Gemmatirosa sp.]|nr:GAF domain-containing sensor histidine kinase [Gemmatirosa sp.]